MSNKKRGQHYVWRKYLEAWSTDDQIWCYRDKKIFHTNLKNVGQQRDFYEPKVLTKDDIQAIQNVLISILPNDVSKKIHLDELKMHEMISDIKQIVEEQDSHQEDIRQLDVALHNIEEDYYGQLEKIALPYLESLISENLSFFESDEDHMNFILFICFQYLRTKKFYDTIMSIYDYTDKKRRNLQNAAWYLRQYGVINIGAHICSNRGLWKLVLLRNQTSIPFVTCDQPVLNTYLYGMPKLALPSDLEFYYPITPRLAALLTRDNRYSYTDKSNIDEIEVNTYNALSVDASHEQIYANEEAILDSLKHLI